MTNASIDRLIVEENNHLYSISSDRKPLDECTEEEFEEHLVGFWRHLGEKGRASQIKNKKIQW